MATETAVPEALQPYVEKGLQAYTQGSYEYAVDLLSHVIKQAPDATEVRRYLRLATQKLYTQSPPSFVNQIAAAVASLPLRAGAMVYSMQGQHKQAVSIYERMLCLQPRSRSVLMLLATTLGAAGMSDAALATYEEVLGVDPNHVPALRKLARLSMKHGNDEQARRCFEKIISILPNDLEAQQGLRNLDALGTIKKGFTT